MSFREWWAPDACWKIDQSFDKAQEIRMKLSEEVRNWYYLGDEIPQKDWADRIAELEAELEYAKRTIKKQDALLESKVLDNAVVALNKANAELEEQNRKLRALVDSYYETCELIRQAHELEG